VRCVQGAFHDVILDIRKDSATFGQSFSVELSQANRRMLYIPHGFAHGFLTLTDDTEALYLVSEFYSPDCERAIRFDDPKFAIQWPFTPIVVSAKDRSIPDFAEHTHL